MNQLCKQFGKAVMQTMKPNKRGVIVRPFGWKLSDDGVFREPGSIKPETVFVEWDDKTLGWEHPFALRLV